MAKWEIFTLQYLTMKLLHYEKHYSFDKNNINVSENASYNWKILLKKLLLLLKNIHERFKL